MKRWLLLLTVLCAGRVASAGDYLRELQASAIENDYSPSAHWGVDPRKYTQWGSHSNRLIPVYTFGTRGAGKGIDLDDYQGANSPYRSEAALKEIYGYLPTDTVNPEAVWLDQTNIYDLQKAALLAGKRHIILVIFDGTDWDITRAASIYNTKSVPYTEGRGRGLHLQEYTAGGTTQFGFMCTSPHNDGTKANVDEQKVLNPGGTQLGGYNAARGGAAPWLRTTKNTRGALEYLIGLPKKDPGVHAYTDSSSSATSMTAGIKTYNNAINVDPTGVPVMTIAHEAQEKGYSVGVVTSVPISHATPACAYAHNVERDDYQDLSRDLLGLPSIAHPEHPLAGVDVLLGAGWGTMKDQDKAQGKNFVPGNRYIADADLQTIDVRNGGQYVTAVRTSGVAGPAGLAEGVKQAIASQARLFGFYGAGSHLPFQTADGQYNPAPGRAKAEEYTPADLAENPTLSDFASAALTVLQDRPTGFWLMIEAGDVDWANHDDNLDTSIGAVNSGDQAVKVVTDWVERHSNWNETVLIVTADHGHYLFLDRPEDLIPQE